MGDWVAGRYELGRALGSGGFATVYRAHDKELRRDVAVKIIPLVGGDRDDADRFRLEALALSQLRSPSVVRVFDFGKDPVVGLYLVMELVEGVALEPASLGRALLAHEVLRAARALLGGLAEVHAARLAHRDVKPANVIVPGGIAGLSDLKLIDFGIARSEHRAQLEALEGGDRPIGTPAYMAPETLLGEESSPAADVYSAGLVLYELLGHTLLFPERGQREQLALRAKTDPALAGRVPMPLDLLLSRMLERDPERRFADAGEALAMLVNMETAPVDISVMAADTLNDEVKPPSRRRSSIVPPRSAFAVARLQRLDDAPIAALRATLHALDLTALDALARRERGTEIGRIARAIALAMRLEIDAAALVLEPFPERLAGSHAPLVKAFATCLLMPRARVATKARLVRGLGLDEQTWIEAVDLELGHLMVSIEGALAGPSLMLACRTRLERILTLSASTRSREGGASHLTAQLALVATTAHAKSAHEEGTEAFEKLKAEHPDDLPTPLTTVVRALLLGTIAFRANDHLARASFETAVQVAGEAGVALFEARALVPLGGMLVEVPGRAKEGVAMLERATTLLLHADAPSLEHMAAHNRGVALLTDGTYLLAAQQFRRAREAASGEVAIELELVSGAQEVIAWLAAGDHERAREVARLLESARNVPVAPREALLGAVACSLVKLAGGNLAGARQSLATAREASLASRGTADDAVLIAEAIAIIYAAGSGEAVDILARAAELHRMGEAHGYAPFYWFDAIRAVVAHLDDDALRDSLRPAVERLLVLLSPTSSRTSSSPS